MTIEKTDIAWDKEIRSRKQIEEGLSTAAKKVKKKKEEVDEKFKKVEKSVGEIEKTLSQFYRLKPIDFVKGLQGGKDVKIKLVKKVVSNLGSIHSNLTEIFEFGKSKIDMFIGEVKRQKKTAKDIDDYLKKIEMYYEYWELIEKRKAKSLPGFLNRRRGRGKFFKEFDEKSPYTIMIYVRKISDKLKKFLG